MPRLLPPDPYGLSPSSQRRLGNHSKEWLREYVGSERVERSKLKEREKYVASSIEQMFAGKGKPMSETPTRRRRRRTTPKGGEAEKEKTAKTKVDQLFTTSQPESNQPFELPEMSSSYVKIRETTFDIGDPAELGERLRSELVIEDALTPTKLSDALNRAETNARLAHQLYVCAKADYFAFEREMDAVLEGMRDAANKDLQVEKAAGARSKAITDADIRGRASVLFPDEWKAASNRRIRAELMVEHIKWMADTWRNRCFSLNSMLNAGKRS